MSLFWENPLRFVFGFKKMIPEHLHLGTGSGFASRSQVLLIFLRVCMCLVTHMWLLLQVWSPEVRSSQMSTVQTAKSAYEVWVISSKRKKTSGGMIHLTYFSCLHSMKRVFLFVGDKAEPRHWHSRLSACGQMIPTYMPELMRVEGANKQKTTTKKPINFFPFFCCLKCIFLKMHLWYVSPLVWLIMPLRVEN